MTKNDEREVQRNDINNGLLISSEIATSKPTFSRRASRAAQDGRQYTPVVLTE